MNPASTMDRGMRKSEHVHDHRQPGLNERKDRTAKMPTRSAKTKSNAWAMTKTGSLCVGASGGSTSIFWNDCTTSSKVFK
jgi:hypothetical protein